MEFKKVKSASKQICHRGPQLDKLVSETMSSIANIVGATLGPGGMPVLIERSEHGMPVTITKDGVTVFRAIGFQDPTKQAIMEAARDAAIRTANEAGDGTTTATVLADALVKRISEYTTKNPSESSQKVVRRMEKIFLEVVDPFISSLSRKADLGTEDGRKILRNVAKISANGDDDLAASVMRCFDICGDEGNVTISEHSGPSHYEEEHEVGYRVDSGYETSAGSMYGKFINSPGTNQCVLDNPVFIVYHGRLLDIQRVFPILQKIGREASDGTFPTNVILVATGFSDNVIGHLAAMFAESSALNVFPLLISNTSAEAHNQLKSLEDLCAITNSNLFDPVNKPLEAAELADLGNIGWNEETSSWKTQGVTTFEAGRTRSYVIGRADENALFERIDNLKKGLKNPESQYDSMMLTLRIAKLSGGIAKLKVFGASNGETKEKRDRAEDAICAVRGAIKDGYLPGGCWTFFRIIEKLSGMVDPVAYILVLALGEPFHRLLSNIGHSTAEINNLYIDALSSGVTTLDVSTGQRVDAYEYGIFDSTPAVREAIRNSISIASLLGTLGGTVVFGRDEELERAESSQAAQYQRDVEEGSR
jgi:chaperonin GroEL